MKTGQFHGFEVAVHDPGIAVITFNTPERLNGMQAVIYRDLVEILTEAQWDRAVRVVVFTGSGRAFNAGDDTTGRTYKHEGAQSILPDIPIDSKMATTDSYDLWGKAPEAGVDRTPVESYDWLRVFSQGMILAVRNLDKPTIAAINGVAVQSGLSLALASDFRIASSEARLGSGTLRFGLFPDEGGHYLLVQILGVSKALNFLLRKKIVSAQEALDWGLVDEVVPHDELMDKAMELALELAENPQVTMRFLKRAIYNAAEMTMTQALDDIAMRAAANYRLDVQEGIGAWREKRAPHFNQWLER